ECERHRAAETMTDNMRGFNAQVVEESAQILRKINGPITPRQSLRQAVAAQIIHRDAKCLGEPRRNGQIPEREIAKKAVNQDEVRPYADLLIMHLKIAKRDTRHGAKLPLSNIAQRLETLANFGLGIGRKRLVRRRLSWHCRGSEAHRMLY